MKKSELLNWLRAEYQQWEALLDQIGTARMDQPGVNGHWSVKDLVAHLTGWNRHLVARLRAAQRDEPEPPPHWPGHLETEDEINDWIYESNKGRSLREVLDESHEVFQELLAVIQGLPDEVLIEQPWHLVSLGGKRYPAAEFFDHFHDDHEADIRAWLARVGNSGYAMDIITCRTVIWQQFGATIDMLDDALHACPDDLWHESLWSIQSEPPEFSQYWYVVFHTLFWLDLYLSGAVEGFSPPAPFTLDELDPAGLSPERPYTKDELQAYLDHCRRKCKATIEALTDEMAQRRCRFPWGELTFVELLLYNMRHVQEHAAQASMFLGQRVSSAPAWITKARSRAG